MSAVAVSWSSVAGHATTFSGGENYERGRKTVYLGPSQADEVRSDARSQPQAFLIELEPPGGTIPPHFHEVAQFQVFVGGDGTLGRREQLSPFVVHYVDPYTPYGPLVTGPNGIEFFNLRDGPAFGSNYMPESRGDLPGKPGRNRTASFPNARLIAADCPSVIPLIEEPDGVTAACYLAPANEQVRLRRSPARGAQFLLVLSGDVLVGGTLLEERSLIFAQATEVDTISLAAGPAGAALLNLGFGYESSDAGRWEGQ